MPVICPTHIDLKDIYTPLAVWSLTWRGWELIRIERPSRAIALCKPPEILVFPTHVHPQELEKELKT
ncbi:MAG: hypothetical protein ACRDEA_15335 [Microcystaceae cyanobacterium]